MYIIKKPKPNPELKKLDKLVGVWNVSGETCGQVCFSWMEGGFFLIQYVDLEGTKGLEFIGYDEVSGTLKSHYFDNDGKVLEYTYKVSETDHIVSINMPGITGRFNGKFNNDGTVITGSWQWKQDGMDLGYKAILTKIDHNPCQKGNDI